MCISSSILKISPLVGEECRDQFLLGIADEFAEFAAEGFRVGSFESMFASDILLDSFWEYETHILDLKRGSLKFKFARLKIST